MTQVEAGKRESRVERHVTGTNLRKPKIVHPFVLKLGRAMSIQGSSRMRMEYRIKLVYDKCFTVF